MRLFPSAHEAFLPLRRLGATRQSSNCAMRWLRHWPDYDAKVGGRPLTPFIQPGCAYLVGNHGDSLRTLTLYSSERWVLGIAIRHSPDAPSAAAWNWGYLSTLCRIFIYMEQHFSVSSYSGDCFAVQQIFKGR
jgi:hypothetical protein